MFNKLKKDFLVYCIENSYKNIEFCNDFYRSNRINKKLTIKKIKRCFVIYLIEKNRHETRRTILYTTKKSNILLKYTMKLYKLLVI